MSGSGISAMAKGIGNKVSQQQLQQLQSKGKEKMGNNLPMMSSWNRPRLDIDDDNKFMPEWKLNSLCAEYDLPSPVRLSMQMGGCGF